jgi:hypothetical protein
VEGYAARAGGGCEGQDVLRPDDQAEDFGAPRKVCSGGITTTLFGGLPLGLPHLVTAPTGLLQHRLRLPVGHFQHPGDQVRGPHGCQIARLLPLAPAISAGSVPDLAASCARDSPSVSGAWSSSATVITR